MAIFSQISIPTAGVPITLQIMVVAFTGYFLGVKRGCIAMVVYILLGIVGVPVFSGLQGGLGVLISYTGGFIFGFIPLTALCGIGIGRRSKIFLGIVGLFLCHFLGTLQYMLLSQLGFFAAIAVVSLPFLVKDILLIISAYLISEIVKKKITPFAA